MVQYQMAASADVYVHRAGRTARGQAEGVCISLITPRDAARFTALLQASTPVHMSSSLHYIHSVGVTAGCCACIAEIH